MHASDAASSRAAHCEFCASVWRVGEKKKKGWPAAARPGCKGEQRRELEKDGRKKREKGRSKQDTVSRNANIFN
jgi:hypothetical protein